MSDQSKLKLGVFRVAVAGAITAAAFFALCWIAALLPIGPASHMYLSLFTSAPGSSVAGLVQGIGWSVVFGLIAGGLFARVYNVLAPLDGK